MTQWEIFLSVNRIQGDKMKIVCIGNSIVNGFPHKRSQCFVSLWRQSTGHEIINKGENGDISSNILARFHKDVISHKPQVAVILTGTNDFIHKINTPKEVLAYLEEMSVMAQNHAIETTFLTPLLVDPALAARGWIPDVDYFAVNEKLRELRALMLCYGTKSGIKIIDTQENFRRLYSQSDVDQYLLDGIHPTLLGHEVMARFLQD